MKAALMIASVLVGVTLAAPGSNIDTGAAKLAKKVDVPQHSGGFGGNTWD